MWGVLILFGSMALAVAGYLRVNRNPAHRTHAARAVVAHGHKPTRPQAPRPQRHSPQMGQRLRPSRMPATPWGRLAYLWAAYVAHLAFTLRDMRDGATTAWRDARTAHSPAPQAVNPQLMADDLAVFAESRAAVATLSYVTPPAPIAIKTSSLNGEPQPEPGTERGLSAEPAPEPLSVGRQKAITEALQAGMTATQIAALLGGRKQTALAEVAKVREQQVQQAA